MPIYSFQVTLDLSREISVKAPNLKVAKKLVKLHSSKIWDIENQDLHET
jgi:hypothetical protein